MANPVESRALRDGTGGEGVPTPGPKRLLVKVHCVCHAQLCGGSCITNSAQIRQSRPDYCQEGLGFLWIWNERPRVWPFPDADRTCSCITQLKAQGPSRTCNESKEEEEGRALQCTFTRSLSGPSAEGGSGYGVQGSGCRVQGAGVRVQGSGFRAQGSGFKVQDVYIYIYIYMYIYILDL